MNLKSKRVVSVILMLAMLFMAVCVPTTTAAAKATSYSTDAETVDPNLFVEEDFDYENGALSGLNGGYGWGNAWWVRNDHTQGYLVDNTAPLSYPGLKSSKPYGTGGWAYCETGRLINTSATKLAPYVSDGTISKVGTTIYVSALYAVKTAGGSNFSLASGQWSQRDNGSLLVGATDSSGTHLSVYPCGVDASQITGNTVSTKTIDNKAHLYVIKMEFLSATSTRVSCYIDPDLAKEPTTADIQFTTSGATLKFRGYYIYPGSGENQGQYDAFRVGSTYEAVTPVTDYKLPVTKVKITPVAGSLDALKGATIMGSNHSATNEFTTIATVPDNVSGDSIVLDIPDNTTKYRYVKLYGKAGSSAKVADIEFYSGNRMLKGDPFGTVNTEGHDAEKAFDGDATTYYEGAQADDQYVGLDLGGEIIAQKPTANPAPGRYDEEIEVALTSGTEGAKIYYTLDGTMPTVASGTLYESPIKISQGKGVIVKAIAVKEGLGESDVFAGGYGIGVDAPVAAGLKSYHLGNSLTDTTNGMFTEITKNANYVHDYMRWTIPGAAIRYLYENQSGGFGYPWYNADTQTYAVDMFAPIDVILFQPFNNGDSKTSGTEIKEFYNKAKVANPDMRIILYGSWGSMPKNSEDTGFDNWHNEYTSWNEAIYEDLKEEYGDSVIVEIAPNSLALKNLQTAVEAGKVEGVTDFSSWTAADIETDPLHLSTNGAYLINLVTFVTMYKSNPVGLITYKPEGMTEAQAAALRQIAWDTCVGYEYANVNEGAGPVVTPGVPTTQPTATATATAKPSATVKPTNAPTAKPSATATAQPTAKATTKPSEVPSDDTTVPPEGGVPPTLVPTSTPTAVPSATIEPPPTNKGGLAAAKKKAKTQLNNYLDMSEYSKEDKELIKTLLQAAEKDIDKLKTVKEVKAYVKMAKKVFDDIPTLAELQGMAKVKIKFAKRKVKVKSGKKFKLKVKLKPSKGLSKVAKKVKWSINKKGRKVVKFVKKAKRLQGKLVVRLKAKKKGKAKITCKAPNGRKAVCTIIVK